MCIALVKNCQIAVPATTMTTQRRWPRAESLAFFHISSRARSLSI